MEKEEKPNVLIFTGNSSWAKLHSNREEEIIECYLSLKLQVKWHKIYLLSKDGEENLKTTLIKDCFIRIAIIILQIHSIKPYVLYSLYNFSKIHFQCHWFASIRCVVYCHVNPISLNFCEFVLQKNGYCLPWGYKKKPC